MTASTVDGRGTERCEYLSPHFAWSSILYSYSHTVPHRFGGRYRRSIFYYDKSWMLDANYIQLKFNDTEKNVLAHSFGSRWCRIGNGRGIWYVSQRQRQRRIYNYIVLRRERMKSRNVPGIFSQMASFTYRNSANQLFHVYSLPCRAICGVYLVELRVKYAQRKVTQASRC